MITVDIKIDNEYTNASREIQTEVEDVNCETCQECIQFALDNMEAGEYVSQMSAFRPNFPKEIKQPFWDNYNRMNFMNWWKGKV